MKHTNNKYNMALYTKRPTPNTEEDRVYRGIVEQWLRTPVGQYALAWHLREDRSYNRFKACRAKAPSIFELLFLNVWRNDEKTIEETGEMYNRKKRPILLAIKWLGLALAFIWACTGTFSILEFPDSSFWYQGLIIIVIGSMSFGFAEDVLGHFPFLDNTALDIIALICWVILVALVPAFGVIGLYLSILDSTNGKPTAYVASNKEIYYTPARNEEELAPGVEYWYHEPTGKYYAAGEGPRVAPKDFEDGVIYWKDPVTGWSYELGYNPLEVEIPDLFSREMPPEWTYGTVSPHIKYKVDHDKAHRN